MRVTSGPVGYRVKTASASPPCGRRSRSLGVSIASGEAGIGISSQPRLALRT
jgi:hypothetical protein